MPSWRVEAKRRSDVATVRALRYNGGVPKSEVGQPNMEALKKGIVNLGAHIENMKKFGVNVIVAINRFESDSDEELEYIREYCRQHGAESAMSEMFAKGGDGGIELALKLVEMCEKETELKFMYSLEMSIKEKIEAVAKNIYGAGGVNYTAQAEKAIKEVEELSSNIPVCIAKTQYSLSDDPSLLGRPENFKITVRDVRLSAGAGFAVVYTGDIMTMPGLPKLPAAEKIDIDEDGVITGLF